MTDTYCERLNHKKTIKKNQSHMGKRALQVEERSMDFLDMVFDSTLLSLVEFWYVIKEKYPQQSEKAVKIFLLFPTKSLGDQIFFIYFNQNET